MIAALGWALVVLGILSITVAAWRTYAKPEAVQSGPREQKDPEAPAPLAKLPPEATKREKALKAMRSSSGLTPVDALRLIDRLQQEQVCEIAIHALEACELYLKNPTDPGLRQATKEIILGRYAVGGDGGISTGTSMHRFKCDECGIVSPSGKNDELAREYAEDLGWLLSPDRDLCPKHKPDEPVPPPEPSA